MHWLLADLQYPLETQVISLGLAEYRSPTPMITAAFVVDHLGADVPSFLSREGVRHRWSRYVSVVTVLSTWDFLDSMGKSMSLAFMVILHKHKASEESNSKKGNMDSIWNPTWCISHLQTPQFSPLALRMWSGGMLGAAAGQSLEVPMIWASTVICNWLANI